MNNLKEDINLLCYELECPIENIGNVIGGLKKTAIEKAINGEDKATEEKIDKFFTARKFARSIYNEEQIALIVKLEKEVAEKGSVGNVIGGSAISSATVSAIRKGKYQGNIDKQFNALKDILERREEKSKIYMHTGYVKTTVSESIFENIRSAHIKGVCAMVTGDAGIGKTEAAKEYIRRHESEAFMITPIEQKTNRTAMLELLAKELGINLGETKRSAYTQKILSEIPEGIVIILDEAQNFQFEAIDTLRGFSDYFRNNNIGTLGIVCMGNDVFRQQFFGKSGIGKEQVWSRFVERPKYESKNIPFSDIELLFPILQEQNMEKELRFLHRIAMSPKESIRSAVNLFSTMYDRGHYDFDSLIKQAKRMQIDIGEPPRMNRR